jgi:hypothetical protein
MRKLTIAGLLSALIASILVASAAGALPKPKPWQWKPAKVVTKLIAAQPIYSASEVLSASCTPQGRGVAGRFSRFTCDTRWRGEGTYTSVLTIRVLPIGTGKLCVVTTAVTSEVLPDIPRAVPYNAGTLGTLIKPERACP